MMKFNDDSKDKMSDQQLLSHINTLPLEMTPDRDLWSGIEKAIQAQPQESSEKFADAGTINNGKTNRSFAWAASLVAAVLLTWGINLPEKQVDAVAVIEQAYTQQKQTILVSYGQPDLTKLSAPMQDQLAQLTSAQLTIKNALAEDPNNTDLLNLLRWTQQQELDLLKQLYSPQWQSI